LYLKCCDYPQKAAVTKSGSKYFLFLPVLNNLRLNFKPINMKTLLKSSLVLLLFSASIIVFEVSCKKDSVAQCPSATYPVAGLWIGTYQTDQVSHAPLFCSFSIYPDGTFLGKFKGNPPAQDVAYATGTWTQVGDSVQYHTTTLNYSTVVEQKGAMKFDNSGKLTGGYWIDLTADGGQFYTGTFPTMARVN
jgi:hypothetical protein